MENVEADGLSVNGRQTNNMAASASQEIRRQKRKERDSRLISRLQRLREVLTKIDSMIAELDIQIKALEKDLQETELLKQTSFNRMHTIEDVLKAVDNDGLTDKHREELKRILGEKASGLTDAELLKLAKIEKGQAHQSGIQADIQAQQIRDALTRQEAARDAMIEERHRIMEDSSIPMEEKVRLLEEAHKQAMSIRVSGVEQEQFDNAAIEENNDENIHELTTSDKAALVASVTITI